jgi:hypothetical protein
MAGGAPASVTWPVRVEPPAEAADAPAGAAAVVVVVVTGAAVVVVAVVVVEALFSSKAGLSSLEPPQAIESNGSASAASKSRLRFDIENLLMIEMKFVKNITNGEATIALRRRAILRHAVAET